METNEKTTLSQKANTETIVAIQNHNIQIFQSLLNGETVNEKKLAELGPEGKKDFLTWVQRKIREADPDESIKLTDKIAHLVEFNDKRQQEIWEENHALIMNFIRDWAHRYHTVPSKTEIAIRLGMSRKTVTKHLTDYKENQKYRDRQEAEAFMLDAIKDSVAASALNGDMRAAKLYWDISVKQTGNTGNEKGHTYINNQHNYLQLNGIVLTQELIASLSPVQLAKIEEVLKGKECIVLK